eukprot:566126-Prorocentrum_minimum.AAC.1
MASSANGPGGEKALAELAERATAAQLAGAAAGASALASHGLAAAAMDRASELHQQVGTAIGLIDMIVRVRRSPA